MKKFVYEGNTYLIQIIDNYTFFSRNEVQELLSDEVFVDEFLKETSNILIDSEILYYKVVTVDSYPALEFTIKGTKELAGYSAKVIMKFWIIYYEDKIVYLQCAGLDGKEFKTLEILYNLITTSVIFPEQYN
ncbi:hypothetical protein ACFLZD_01785 [Candidatus Neomarinimicrobiota bacterium]